MAMEINSSFTMPPSGSPVLSIITISYRDSLGLSHTVESLRALLGSHVSWEHVLVDSSPEVNGAVLKSLGGGWPLQHIQSPPRGVYPAMNEGISRAKGTYLWFLNGGDVLLSPAALAQMIEFMSRNPGYSSVCGAAKLMRGGVYQYTHGPIAGRAGLWGMNRVCHQAMIYRRDLFDRIGRYSEQYKIAADYEHHLRADIAGEKTAIWPTAFVGYDMGGRSGDTSEAFAEFAAVYRALRRQLSFRERCWHWTIWFGERARVGIFKFLGKTPVAKLLRPLWIAWKRKAGDMLEQK